MATKTNPGPTLDEVEANEHYAKTVKDDRVRWCSVHGCVRPVRASSRRCPHHRTFICSGCSEKFVRPQNKLYRFCSKCRQEHKRLSRGGGFALG